MTCKGFKPKTVDSWQLFMFINCNLFFVSKSDVFPSTRPEIHSSRFRRSSSLLVGWDDQNWLCSSLIEFVRVFIRWSMLSWGANEAYEFQTAKKYVKSAVFPRTLETARVRYSLVIVRKANVALEFLESPNRLSWTKSRWFDRSRNGNRTQKGQGNGPGNDGKQLGPPKGYRYYWGGGGYVTENV